MKNICPKCHESVDPSDPLTLHSSGEGFHTGNYYHHMCEPYVWHMPRSRAFMEELREISRQVEAEFAAKKPKPAKAKRKQKDKNVCCECGEPAVVMHTGEGLVKYYCDNCVQGKPNSIGGTVGGVYYCPYCGDKKRDDPRSLARHVVEAHPSTNGIPSADKDWRVFHYCPFCREELTSEGVRDHVLAQHPGAMMAFEEKFNRSGTTYHLGYFCNLVAGRGVTVEPVAAQQPRQLVQASLSKWVSA